MQVILINDHWQAVSGSLTSYIRRRMLVDLTILADQYKDQGWSLVRPEEAVQAWLESSGALLVFPDFRLMMVSTCAPWFASDQVLNEEWIGQGITTEDAVKAMKAVASQIGVQRIEVGTRATPGQRHEAASRLYQRLGLRPMTITLGGNIHEQETRQ